MDKDTLTEYNEIQETSWDDAGPTGRADWR